MDFTALKNFLDALTSWRIPGNGVKVCLEGREVFSYTSGYANVEKQIPMTLDHFVNIYSCSKVATVTAALQLYEQGKFLLDDPLYAFIPEFNEPGNWCKAVPSARSAGSTGSSPTGTVPRLTTIPVPGGPPGPVKAAVCC